MQRSSSLREKVCHLLSHPPPDEPFEPGDVVAYRCADCMDRWDIVLAVDE